MSDTFSQYSRTVQYYSRYRPRYPESLLEWLKRECALTPEQIIADVGSGTGQMTELLLKHGNPVYGIEPNEDMRRVAEQELQAFPRFMSLGTTAETTNLPDDSIHLITVGNAFHWFDHARTRQEFRRILKPQGWVVLAWNLERNNGSPFAAAYEQFWQRHIDPKTQFMRAGERKRPEYISRFLGSENLKTINLDNFQVCDFEAFIGVPLSFLKAPQPGDPRYPIMLAELETLFNRFQVNGVVTLEYDTAVSCGQLLP